MWPSVKIHNCFKGIYPLCSEFSSEFRKSRSGRLRPLPSRRSPRQEMAARNNRRASLPALDDEYRLVVNDIGFAKLLQAFIAFDGIVKQSVTDFAGWLVFVIAYHPLQLRAFLVIIAIVDSVGIEKQYVAGTHQRNLRHIGRVHLPFSQADGKI